MTQRTMRCTGDDGQLGGFEGVAFGFLIFVLGILVVANAWGVIDAKMATTAAAREAARTFVESRAGSTTVAYLEAKTASEDAIVGHGRSLARLDDLIVDGALTRCARVTMTVTYHVPLVSIPVFGQHGSGFVVVGRHTEIVDPYRSGLHDRNTCPAGLP